MEKIIESTEFYDVIETTTTHIKPNIPHMEKEISCWLRNNKINGLNYKMYKLNDNTLHLLHTNDDEIDGEFSRDDAFCSFLKTINNKYRFRVSLPIWYFHK